MIHSTQNTPDHTSAQNIGEYNKKKTAVDSRQTLKQMHQVVYGHEEYNRSQIEGGKISGIEIMKW